MLINVKQWYIYPYPIDNLTLRSIFTSFNKQNNNTMQTYINQFGEEVTKWTSHKHPDNPNFMQVVNWYVWVKPDGRVNVGYNLGCNGKTYFLYGVSKEEALSKFVDVEEKELTDADFEKWLSERKQNNNTIETK